MVMDQVWDVWLQMFSNVQWVSQLKILNQKPCILLFRRNLVKPRASYSELSVNTTRLQAEWHTIDLLSIQIDKYEKFKSKLHILPYLEWKHEQL